MTTINKFKELLKVPEQKKQDINESIKDLQKELDFIENQILDAEINNKNCDDLILQSNMLKSNLERELKKGSIVNGYGFTADFIKKNDELKEVVEELQKEISENLETLRTEYSNELENLNKIKLQYLEQVNKLGKVFYKAEKLAGDLNYVNRQIDNNIFIPGILNNDINFMKKTGAIFLEKQEIESHFKAIK